MYRERRSRIGGAVVWSKVTDTPAPGRVLPDGCMDLIYSAGDLLVAGPDTRAQVVAHPPGTVHVGLRFAPGTGPLVFGVPAVELRDRRVPLDQVWPSGQARRLAERLAEADDPAAVLETAARTRLRDAGPPDPIAAAVVRGLRRGAAVAEVAEAVALSERQLHRRCLTAFGYGAKTLARVLRLGRALYLARTGLPFAAVAADAGYADQAHLAREVRALTGVPLGVLLAGG